jgi:hypothetical protein
MGVTLEFFKRRHKNNAITRPVFPTAKERHPSPIYFSCIRGVQSDELLLIISGRLFSLDVSIRNVCIKEHSESGNYGVLEDSFLSLRCGQVSRTKPEHDCETHPQTRYAV